MDKCKKIKTKDKRQDEDFISGLSLKVDMTDKEVEEEFAKFVDEMNLTLDKREPLFNRTIDQKRLLILQTRRTIDTSTSRYIHSLESILEGKMTKEKIVSALDSLKVHLTNSPLSRVKEFYNSRGLELLIKVFSMYIDFNDVALSCLKCIRAFGNCGYGLLILIHNEEALLHVALCLNASYPTLMLLAIELLTLFTFYSFDSHSNVLQVLFVSSIFHGQEERFMSIVEGLATGINDLQTNLIVPCLQFINVIVSPNFKDVNTCSNLDSNYSMHLRIEFVRCGLNSLLDQLLASNPDEVIIQNISVFQFDNDYEEDYTSKMNLVKTCLKDRDTVYHMLSQTISNTNCDTYLTSIMKHLLIIKDDPIRYHLYRLIDDIVAELIIHSDGMSPDPMLNQLDSYNLTDLFEKFNDMKDMCGSEVQDKLDKAIEEKHEAEAKLFAFENKHGLNVKIDTYNAIPPPPSAPPPPGAPPPPMAPPGPPPLGIRCPPPPPGLSAPNIKGPVMNGIEQSLPFGMQIKTPIKPKLPMKKANWSKVEIKLLEKSCIWKKINDDDININEALKELGERFCTKSIKPKELNEDDVSINSYSSLPRKIKDFKVLDAKSGQNLAILSGSLKVPHREIKRRILELDEGLLSQTNVENLLKNLPPIEQLNMLAKMNDDYENLNEAEQLGCTLASINCLHSRLNSLLFKMKFNERVSEIKPAIICATEALNEVRNSVSLPKVLELILYFGNFMNSNSKTSLTVGFHLNFLTKLTGTKDNIDATLMEFLVVQIKSHFPSLLSIVSELSYLNKASRISTESINSTISEMKSIKNNLDRELKNYKKQAENDNYLEIMKTFLVSVNEQLNLISEMNAKLQQAYKDMANYFSFDLIKYPMEEFFQDMKQFKDDFYKSILNVEEAAQMDIKRRKTQEEKEKREKERLTRERQKMIATNEEDDRVLDNLLATLNSGAAYGYRQRNRNKELKKERLHMVNRSRSRKEFDIDTISPLEK